MKRNRIFLSLFAVMVLITLNVSLAQDMKLNNTGSGYKRKSFTESQMPVPTLCEQFLSAAFPPAGWTVTGSGSAFWGYNPVSGFGAGTGSAMYNMWSAPTGDDGNLITLTFGSLPANSGLALDIAYSPFPANGPPYSQDSLFILASTDSGTTYSAVAGLGPTALQSAPASGTEFTPTSGQWKRMYFALPSGTNKVNLLGRSHFGNDLFLDSICTVSLVGITNNQGMVPGQYLLLQNYPNPFNPSTTFNFGLPKGGLVKLIVYDITGREVKTLVNEFKNAGTYSVTLDASALASGVYLYKLIAGDFLETKKMVLIK